MLYLTKGTYNFPQTLFFGCFCLLFCCWFCVVVFLGGGGGVFKICIITRNKKSTEAKITTSAHYGREVTSTGDNFKYDVFE